MILCCTAMRSSPRLGDPVDVDCGTVVGMTGRVAGPLSVNVMNVYSRLPTMLQDKTQQSAIHAQITYSGIRLLNIN